MMQVSFALGLALLGEALASQQPLFASPASSQVPVIDGKELVSSESILGRIDANNLLKRAKKLYSIAELGEEEYNHPTRVIGSKGTYYLPISFYERFTKAVCRASWHH